MTSQYLPPDAQAETVGAPVELLPCPFCGAKVHVTSTSIYHGAQTIKHRITCLNPSIVCPLGSTNHKYGKIEWAIVAWNRRTPDPLLVPALEALRKAREALHFHYVEWDGEPEDVVPLQLARSKCDAILAQAKERGL